MRASPTIVIYEVQKHVAPTVDEVRKGRTDPLENLFRDPPIQRIVGELHPLRHGADCVLVSDADEPVTVVPLELTDLACGNLSTSGQVPFIVVGVVEGAVGE